MHFPAYLIQQNIFVWTQTIGEAFGGTIIRKVISTNNIPLSTKKIHTKK